MTLINFLIPFLAAILGGTLNAVAGGGSFITFPSLVYAGVPPIQANATSTTALWPGSVAAIWAFRRELAKQSRVLLLTLSIVSLIGGVVGAILLLVTPQTTFVRLIPFLILIATLLFALSPWINARIKQRAAARKLSEEQSEGSHLTPPDYLSWPKLLRTSLLQMVIAVYGGYFGGGIGILQLASFGAMGMEDIHEMNAIKNATTACINGIAVVTFIIAGAVFWGYALLMIVGAIIGGYGAAYYARKLDQRIVRAFVILVGCIMTVYFFVKYGLPGM
ncbi:MAG TPA: sulfite exporter TauE/SafE family protein [Ktedonobacteraceae bacterium]|nr:sulfite exporter TauE/SafE family protein [Ktedonobacteraceae bacterium]